MFAFIKSHKIVTALAAIIVVGGAIGIFVSKTRPPVLPESYTVGLHDVREEVSVTGRVRAADDVDLAFEKSGRVVSVPVKVGQFVSRGSSLASLESSEPLAALREAEARVRSEEARLAELVRGARTEDVAVSLAKVEQSKGSLESSKQALADAIQDSYTTSDDAIRNKVDQFFSNPRTSAPQISGFVVGDVELKTRIQQSRQEIESLLNTWINSLPVSGGASSLDGSLAVAQANLVKISQFLSDVSLAVNGATASASLSQATIDGWKSAVSSARTSVSASVSELSSAKEDIRTKQSGLAVAEREYSLKIAGTASEQIDAQKAVLDQAKASVLSAQAQLAKNTIRAPFDGVVTNIEVDPGEIVSANNPAVTLISRARFEIEANIPEADIAHVAKGAHASITLDAYGADVVFDAVVASVDPAETLIDGVATYRSVLQFSKQDTRIRSGMTANIDIRGDERLQVVAIPQRAVISRDGSRFVRKIEGDKVVDVQVETGLRGSDGFIEIKSGISSGDKVVVYNSEE